MSSGGDISTYLKSMENSAPQPQVLLEGHMGVNAVRAQQEVQGAIVLAKKFPRDFTESLKRIQTACQRVHLAEVAQYSYPRGGQTVSGPSIRLAEELARNWGNLDFGIRELSQGNGESVVEAYCWDLETNVRQTKVFTVKHERHSNKKGIEKLKDPRDIYEIVANNGARRLRACILGVIPADVTDMAVKECENTLKNGKGMKPFADRINDMVLAFDQIGVKKDDIESRLTHKIEAVIPHELIELQKIYVSIRDGFTKRGDWFEAYAKSENAKTADINEKLQDRADSGKQLQASGGVSGTPENKAGANGGSKAADLKAPNSKQ